MLRGKQARKTASAEGFCDGTPGEWSVVARKFTEGESGLLFIRARERQITSVRSVNDSLTHH